MYNNNIDLRSATFMQLAAIKQKSLYRVNQTVD